MRPQPLVIHLRSERDAECVAEALSAHVATVEQVDDRWDVHVEIPARALDTILSALHECLVANEIRMVRLSIDEKSYAMEAVPGA